MKQYILAFLSIVVLSADPLAASDSLKTKQSFPLVVAFGNHTLSFPWYNKPLTYRFNPGMMVGTEHTYKRSKHFRLYQTGNLGFFQQELLESGLFLESDLGFSYLTGFGPNTAFLIGAGYMHTFSRRAIFEFKNGEYQQVTDWGKPAFMFSLALEIGYDFKKQQRFSFSPFIQYRWFVQTPFSEEIPAMTHLLLTVGTKIHFGGK